MATPRTMFCARHLKYYQMNGKHRDYSSHSKTLEAKLEELNTNSEYRDSLELSWIKYCLRAHEDIQKNGKTDSKKNNRYYYHDVLKSFPQYIRNYHQFIDMGDDIDGAKGKVAQQIKDLTNTVGDILNQRQESPEVVTIISEFTLGLEWFVYKSPNFKASKEDKILSFLARWKVDKKK
jgi:hypothetical protein|tara:strand:+ start:140 stop:673 length:534 start_codon:yes stop_codon:yes gene_type:complete